MANECANEAIHPNWPSVRGLSRREQEVAALVAQGLTNDDISKRWYVSAKRVEKHIGNILGKLGYERRAQMAS